MEIDARSQTTLRKRLSRRRDDLRAEIDAAERARRNDADALDDVSDRDQEAADAVAAEIDEAEERRDVLELADVDAALARLDAGRYGECADCGEPIPMQRLRAQPAARRCVACQTAYEQAM